MPESTEQTEATSTETETELEAELEVLDLTEDELDELPHEVRIVESSSVTLAPAPLDATPADPELAAAIRIAEAALDEVTAPTSVGAFVDVVDEGEGVFSLRFATSSPGHTDWFWTVTMVRLADADEPSVLECELLPGSDSLLAPAWVPWAERLAEYRATHDRHGNVIAEADAEASEAEGAEGEGAASRESVRASGRTRTRRRLRRDRERATAEDAAAEDASKETLADAPSDDSAEASVAAESVADAPAADCASEKKRKKSKGDKADKKKSAKKKADKADKSDKAKDKKADKHHKQRSRLEVTEVVAPDALPVAADIREYADDMDDVLDGVEFETN